MSVHIVIEGEMLAEWVAVPILSLWRMLKERPDWTRDIDTLSAFLYTHWYCAIGAPQEADPLPGRLVSRLRAAHAESRRYESNWIVEELRPDLGPGTIVATRGPVRKVVSGIGYFVPERPLVACQPGQHVHVTMHRDSVSEGSWRTWSESWSAPEVDPMARFYWSVPFVNMPAVVATFTNSLKGQRPWMLKMAIDTTKGPRRDSTVLYVRSTDMQWWRGVVRDLYEDVKGSLGVGVPALSRPLAPGLAVAEDPVGDASFGEDRCKRIGAAVLEHPESLLDATQLAACIHANFGKAGLDLRQPDRRSAAASAT